MSGILSEIFTDVVTQTDDEGNTRHIYTFNQEKSKGFDYEMGSQKIPVFSNMSVEDQRTFNILKHATKQLKVTLRADGEEEFADALPDEIATPPEFVLAYHAYTMDKAPLSNTEYKRTLGTLSAMKGRNPEHIMAPGHLADIIGNSVDRLTRNIRSLAGGTSDHNKGALNDIARLKSPSAAHSLSSIMHHGWVTGLKGSGTKDDLLVFPSNTVIVPLSTTAVSKDESIITMFANELSAQTKTNGSSTPIVNNAFFKSNNPRVSEYTHTKTKNRRELRIGTDFVGGLIDSSYYNLETFSAKALKRIHNFVNDIGIDNLKDITQVKVKKAIEKLSDEDKEVLASEIPTKSGVKYPDNGAKLNDYYKGLVQYVRVCVTRDYDGNRRQIDKLLKQITDLDADKAGKDNKAVISKRNELIDEVKTRKEFLAVLPTPNLEAGRVDDQTSYAALKRMLNALTEYYKTLDISHQSTDKQIATIQKKLQAVESKAPLAELERLYRYANSKMFKISGARPQSGVDAHKAFSRFQLANVNIARQLHGKHVVIVDDNISTGATIKDAVVSLYINGIVPKSIVVLAPHRLKYSGTFERNNIENPGIENQAQWSAARRRIEADIKRGDEAHKIRLAQELEKEMDVASETGALKLATLAVDIATGKSKLNDIVKANKLLPNVDDYEKFTNIVTDLTAYSKQYKDWFAQFIKSLESTGTTGTWVRAAPKAPTVADINDRIIFEMPKDYQTKIDSLTPYLSTNNPELKRRVNLNIRFLNLKKELATKRGAGYRLNIDNLGVNLDKIAALIGKDTTLQNHREADLVLTKIQTATTALKPPMKRF